VYSYWVKKKKKQKEACGSNTSRKEDASNLFDNKNQHNNIKEDKATDCSNNTNQGKKKKRLHCVFWLVKNVMTMMPKCWIQSKQEEIKTM